MMRSLRCATCGTDEPRSESRFCRVCGAPLPQAPLEASPAARSVDVGSAPLQATISAGRAPVAKTIPEREPPKRVAPTRVDPSASSAPSPMSSARAPPYASPVPSSPGSNPVPYRLSPAPPIPYPASQPYAHPPAAPGLSFGGLVVRALVAIALSVGALLASDQAYERVKKPAGEWVSETFAQDRATARAIVGGGIAVAATLVVTMTVLLVSTRRRS